MYQLTDETGLSREHPVRHGSDSPGLISKNESNRRLAPKLLRSPRVLLSKVPHIVEKCGTSVQRALREHSHCLFLILLVLLGQLLAPDSAWSFQSHPAPEGLYAHQMAHIFFIIAMGMLAYWLEFNRFTLQRGWRLIQVSCIFFLIWNLVAIAGHWVEVQIPGEVLQGDPDWTQRIELGSNRLNWVYYFLKLDHLYCVPAIVCLFLGVRSLYLRVLDEEPKGDD